MCRLFGLISKEKSNAKYWFFDADIPFKKFSEVEINRGPHNSGWGVGWLEGKSWKIFKEGKSNVKSYSFDKINKIKSKIILIHLRKASVGDESTKNAHPFVYADWIFEHNGGMHRQELIKHLDEDFKKELNGETDSEVFFYLVMQNLKKGNSSINAIKNALIIAKKYDYRGLNFILSNGKETYVYRDVSLEKKDLFDYYCLHYLVKNSEVIISSDALTKNDKWLPLKLGDLMFIDSNHKIIIKNII